MQRSYLLESCQPAVVSCVVCGTRDNCHRETTSNEIFCSSCLQSVDPATSWWGPIQRGNVESYMDNDIDTPRLGNVQVMEILMRNGSHSKQAKQARLASTHRVSIGDKTGLLKDEPLMLKKVKRNKRKAELRHKRTATDRVEACQRTKMRPISSYYLGNNLSQEATETDDVDSALSLEVMEYSSFNCQLEICDKAHASSIRDRLWTFRDQMLAKNDAKAYLTINA
jgi:hypothetical protein